MEGFNHAGEIGFSGNKNQSVTLQNGHKFNVQSSPQLKIVDIEIRQDPDDKMYPCPFCRYRFNQSNQLQNHLHTHRKKRPNEVFNVIHVDVNPYKCDKCKSSFLNKQELEKHAARHNPVECKICHKVYATKYTLKNHYRLHTEEKPYECPVDSNTYKCDKCNSSFVKKQELEMHAAQHNPVECEICHKNFGNKYNLKLHYRIHTEEKPYECEICCKKCSSRQELKQHYFNHVNEELDARRNCVAKSVKCYISHLDENGSVLKPPVKNITSELQDKVVTSVSVHKNDNCPKVFLSKVSLPSHRLIHEKYESYYECNVCHKYFTQTKGLARHSVVHSKEKPFECYVCKRRFKTKNYLKSHVLTHTNEQSFECDVCHKRFTRIETLRQHCRRHSSVKEEQLVCEICGEHLNKNNSEIHYLTRHCLTKFSE